MRDRVVNFLVYLTVFLLPWQTRWIFGFEELRGEVWEYGLLSLFLTEMLVILVAVLRPRIQARKRFDWPLIFGGFFLIAALISVQNAINPTVAVLAWLHILVAYLFFRNLLDKRIQAHKLLYAFVLGLIGPAVLGIYQFVVGSSPASTMLGIAAHEAGTLGDSVIESMSGRFLRAYGSFQHPNIFGGYLALGLIALFMLPRWYHRVTNKVGFQVMATLFAAALILTFSRSAWLAFFSAMFIGGWIMLWEHRVAAKKAIPTILVALAAVLVTIVIFWQPFQARFHPSYRLEAISISERTTGYSIWWPTVKDKIFFGTGVGNYTVELADDRPGNPVWAFQPIHNSILLVLGEVGIVGLFFLVLWAASVDRINYAALPRSTAIGALTMGAAVLVIACFDHYLFSLWPGLALMALVFALTLRLSEP
ncbi:MAG: O-antigen ligase family protein [Candidatus Uhrbacteria bacterium]|nr:O-antigen ligase family protein [Patescibacteria group bacterium]MBU1906532.1 O-antigen ligase family protein [Patescibacteria group bacterium]